MLQDKTEIAEYREILTQWWKENGRTFPWRHDRTPYRTAVAELMLRRTRADQVVPVFKEFLRLYPGLKQAAEADQMDMENVLRPLGLLWRARDMASFFQLAYQRFGEELPLDVTELRSLPGVGEYVSAAIVCFAGNQTEPLIDTNVVRVLGRIFGLSLHGEARRRRDMRDLAGRAVDVVDPSSYHYALLDFGAKICVSTRPRCVRCPFSNDSRCAYYVSVTCSEIEGKSASSNGAGGADSAKD